MIRGTARVGTRTKALITRLRAGDIAVIDHPDLDEVAADGLRQARVRAVINLAPSITGRYPNLGPSLLLAAGVPLLDAPRSLARALRDGDAVAVDDDGRVYRGETAVATGTWLTPALVAERLEAARTNLPAEVERFIDNTLEYARREKAFVVEPLPLPPLKVDVQGRHALVVVRGHNYRADLAALGSYIHEMQPVLIGVDGGADALREAGFPPDIIIGDMDSVSDLSLLQAADVIVHGYRDGRAPGLARVQALGVPAHVIPAPGTSEDLALLVAYEAGAELIVAVGTHSNLIDFLEKGRSGMASTFLVRLKVGSRLVDARGVSQLYRGRPRPQYPVQIALAALVPAAIVIALAPSLRELLRLAWLQARVWLGW
ncbi:MAG TPA: putative cytokinetic ring protein SteA [Limnochordales bacterium]